MRARLTKNELKRRRDELKRLRRYLPTLHIKKRQLQAEREAILKQAREHESARETALSDNAGLWTLLSEQPELLEWLEKTHIKMGIENTAGIDTPVLEQLDLAVRAYSLADTRPYVDELLEQLLTLARNQIELAVIRRRLRAVEAELTVTSQRVNLFEKVKIPEAEAEIRRITIHLGDEQTSAFGWALVLKRKLAKRAAAQ